MAKGKGSQQANVAGLVAGAKELQKRVLFVLMVLVVYRIGSHIPLPGIDAVALSAYNGLQEGLFGMFNMFSGGALSRMAIFALSVFPYITASIVIQLLTATSPTLGELKKEGETGRRKINQYTRYLTVFLAFMQGFGMAAGIQNITATVGSEVVSLVPDPGMAFRLQSALAITTGTMFLMWLGEQINSKGIGNGISLLIFAGIVAEMPGSIYQLIELSRTGSLSGFILIGFLILIVALIAFIVYMEMAQRRVLVQYPKRQVGLQQMAGGEASHMPLKLNMSGVMPAIFASALLAAPLTLAEFYPNSAWAQTVGVYFGHGQPAFTVIYAAMIMFFCFFYTATVAFNTEETADNLKKNGGFIPGVRPGKNTADYLDHVATRITVIGASYVTLVCVLPEILYSQFGIPLVLGGTSLLIMVSVTMDTVTRVQSYLIAQRYEGLLQNSALRGGRKNKGKK